MNTFTIIVTIVALIGVVCISVKKALMALFEFGISIISLDSNLFGSESSVLKKILNGILIVIGMVILTAIYLVTLPYQLVKSIRNKLMKN